MAQARFARGLSQLDLYLAVPHLLPVLLSKLREENYEN